jgi:S1-C subfamily serine protease
MKRTATGAALVTGLIVVLFLAFGVSSAKKYKSYTSKTPWIGVYTQEIDKDLAEAFDLNKDEGIVIVDVVDDSPAEEAGLRRKDVIIEFDGKKVDGSEPLADFVADTKIGDDVDVVVLRKGKKKDLTIEIGEKPESNWRDYTRQAFTNQFLKNNLALAIGQRGYMGVAIQGLNDQLGDYFGVKDGDGVLITQVEEDSPAEKAGLKAGDVIIGADDEEIDDTDDIFDVMSDKEEGDTVTVTYLRKGEKHTVPVEVTEESYSMHNVSLPNLNIQIPNIPSIKGIDRFKLDKEYNLEMDDFRVEMKQLQKELQELRDDLKELESKLD